MTGNWKTMKGSKTLEWVAVGLGSYLLTILLYWPTRDAGFTSDFTAHLQLFDENQAQGWWNSFGWKSNQPILFGIMYRWHQWFGLQGMPWFLLFTGIHALNATLLYQLLVRMTTPGKGVWLAIAGSLLFLLHPYQCDGITWKVCVHYLISTASLLGLLVMLFRYASPWPWYRWIGFHLLFATALLSLELALVYPFILGGTYWWLARENGQKGRSFQRHLTWIMLPQILLLGLYFLWNKLRFSTWVGHYGEDVHFRILPEEVISHALNYFFKYLAFSRDWPFAVKRFLGEWHWQHPLSMYSVAALGLGLLLFLVYYSRKKSIEFRQGLWAVIVFFIALAPILTLYYAWLGHNENDRYGYLASAFFIVALIKFGSLVPRPLAIAGIFIYGLASVLLLMDNIQRWSDAQRVYSTLVATYQWENEQEVYILGMPDSYQGIMLFRGFIPGEGLRDAVYWIGNKKLQGRIIEVSAYVMQRPGDGVAVRQLDDRTYQVDFQQWGNWWVREGIGASNYETEDYTVTFHEGGYTLVFKENHAERTLIYNQGGLWKTVVP